jgi:KUP system potassium uptake protein
VNPGDASAKTAGERPRGLGGLLLGAMGLVFGNIGTSPLYALRETFAGPQPLPLDRANILGVLSLTFWSLIVVVTVKYVTVMLRADNRGEGGSLALGALVGSAAVGHLRLGTVAGALALFAATLVYGDSMITPALSVLSAVEGLRTVMPQYGQMVIPAAVLLVFLLFLTQRQGMAAGAALTGPLMLAWFVVLAILGIRNMALAPEVLKALSPHYAVLFLAGSGLTGFLALGSVVLAVTGCETLYAEMGRFGRLPIRLGWYLLVLPALVLNYFGQGALLLARPEAIDNPFFRLAPAWAAVPLLVMAVAAAAVTSQAVVASAFSLTRQAIQLGYLPQMSLVHTSEQEAGHIYIPFMNWALMVAVGGLVVGFGSSTQVASAYGLAVTGSMLIGTLLLALVVTLLWGWRGRRTAALLALFVVVDSAFFLANFAKIPHGGWFPLAVGGVMFGLLVTWKSGCALLNKRLDRDTLSVETFIAALSDRVPRVAGTAIFLTGPGEGVPMALLHNLKHNKIIHERVVICPIVIEDVPFVPPERRVESQILAPDFQRLVMRFGFMEDTNIPRALAQARTDQLGFFYEPMSISYFLSRESVVPSSKPGMAMWREHLFAGMSRSAASAMDFFHLPSVRVVELGIQVEI